MADLVMDFIHGLVQAPENIGRTDIENPIREAAASITGNQQAYQNALQSARNTTGLGPNDSFTGGLRTFAGNAAQIGLDAFGGEIAKPVESLAAPLSKGIASTAGDIGENIAGKAIGKFAQKVAGGAAQTAVGGAAVGAAQGVAQGVANTKQKLNAKNLTLDFLQGAESGAQQGAEFGSLAGATGANRSFNRGLGENGPVGAIGGMLKKAAKPGLVDDDTAAELAKETDSAKIEKKLEPTTGPVVAKDVAPAVAMTNDPNVAKNIINNDIQDKLSPATPPEPETPIPQPTATDNVTSPQGVSAEEQSLYDSQPQNIPEQKPLREFMNAPGEEPSGTSSVSHLQTLQEMGDILQNGGTVDEALAHYMDKHNADYGTAQDAFGELRNSQGFKNGDINAGLNPRYEEGKDLVGSKIPAGDVDSVMTKTRMAHNAIMREGTKAIVEVRQLAPEDLQLMDEARDKTPEQVGQLATRAKDPAQFLRAYQATKNYDDYAQGIGSGGLGQDVAYRQNHLLSKYMMSPEEEALQSQAEDELEKPPENQGRAQQPTRPGYAMGRNGGGIPRNENFLQDLEQDVGVKSQHIAQLTFAKSLGEAFPDQVAQGNLPNGYSQVKLPFAKGISLPNDIADELNKRAPVTTSGALKGYDTVNSALKNLKLGGGLFHSVNVAGTFIGQQIASGKLFTHPEDAAEVLKSTFSPEAMKDKMSELDNQGMLRAADRLGLEYNKFGVQADVGGHGKLDNIPILKQIHESTFGRQIPMMKMLTLQQKLADAGIDPKNMSDEDIQTGTKIAKEINQNYGGINRMIQGLTPGQFKTMSRVLLATDYTEGQLRTLTDAFSKGGAEGRLAREAVIGKALLFAGVATAAGALGGEFKGQTPKQIAGDILMKTINPDFQFGGYTVGLPETQLSEFAKPVAESIANAHKGDNAANPFKDFLTARLAAVPSEAEQLATNRNFQGNPLHGTDYFGRPISGAQTVANLVSGLVPIPASEAAQTATGQQNVAEGIANTAGLNVKPTYPTSYAPIAGQTYISELEKTPGVSKKQIAADTEFFDLLEQGVHNKNKVLNQMEAAIAKHNPKKADQLMNSYNQNLLQSLLPWQKSGGTVYLDTTMLQLLKTAQITYKKANENVAYDVKTNPTAYGVPISALAQTPQTVTPNQVQGV